MAFLNRGVVVVSENLSLALGNLEQLVSVRKAAGLPVVRRLE